MRHTRKLYCGFARRLAVAQDGQGRWWCALAAVTAGGHGLRVVELGQPRSRRGGAGRPGTSRSGHTLLAGSPGILDVCLACDQAGQLVAVWSELAAGGAALRYAARRGDGSWTAASAMVAMPGSALAPAVVRDAAGRVWCAFASSVLGKHHVFITWYESGQWSFPQRISDGDGHCFAPALCRFGAGVRVVWDACIDGTFGIYMREVAAEPRISRHQPQAAIVRTEALVANPTIAALDSQTSLVVWEAGRPGWGRRNEVPRQSAVELMRGHFLRSRRELMGAIIAPAGSAFLAEDLEQALPRLPGTLSRARPVLPQDASGRLWLAWRELEESGPKPARQGYRLLASAYRDGCWQPAVDLPDSGAAADGPALLTRGGDPDAPALVGYVQHADRRYRAHVVALDDPGARGGAAERPRAGRFRPMSIPRFAEPAVHVRLRADGREGPLLLWGDLHRHSDLSRCWRSVEGTAQDNYRYALGVAELDFLALTDHGLDLRHPDRQADAATLVGAYNLPGMFTAFVACEVNTPRQGHMVVLTDADRLEIPPDRSRQAVYRRLDPAHHLVIPHHMGDPVHRYPWQGHDEKLSPVAEVYQPYRTAFEAPGAPAPLTAWVREGHRPLPGHTLLDAWRSGLRLGVVASSDHLATGGALAGVWALGNSRRDILEALRARRCYAATDRIRLAFWADGHFMGERFSARGRGPIKLPFKVLCRGTAVLTRLELLCDGAPIHCWTPRPGARPATQVHLRRKLPVAAGEHAYTVRVHQQGNHMAWSSPIWIVAP